MIRALLTFAATCAASIVLLAPAPAHEQIPLERSQVELFAPGGSSGSERMLPL